MGIIGMTLSVIAFHKHSIVVFKGNGEKSVSVDEPFVLSDRLIDGNSEAKILDSEFGKLLDFRLRTGFVSPFASIAFPMIPAGDMVRQKFFDFSAYDSVKIICRTARAPRVSLRFVTHDPQYTQTEIPESGRPAEILISTERMFSETRAALANLKVPEKWFDWVGIEVPDNKLYLDRGYRLEVRSALGTMLGIPDEIEVKEIELFGLNRQFLWIMGIGLSAWILGFAFVFKIGKNIDNQKQNMSARLTRAVELLKTTSFADAEIAERVGYQTCREFQSEFKKTFHKTPKEWKNCGE